MTTGAFLKNVAARVGPSSQFSSAPASKVISLNVSVTAAAILSFISLPVITVKCHICWFPALGACVASLTISRM